MSGSGILFLFLASSAIFLLMGLSLVLFVMIYQKKMMRQAEELQQKEVKYQEVLLNASIKSQEEERRRIAGELHDGLGAHLSAIRLQVLLYGQDHKDSQAFSEETAEMLSQSIRSVREISHGLLPGTLKAYGLIPALKELFGQMNTNGSTRFDLEWEGEQKRMEEEKELALFRIVQELLNNALKHSKANEVTVRIHWDENYLLLFYSDDGIGFDPEKVGTGLGMYTIQSRCQSVKASYHLDAAPGKGLQCQIKVPLSAIT